MGRRRPADRGGDRLLHRVASPRRGRDVPVIAGGRRGLALALGVGLLVVGAGPALADPPGPTGYEATVVALEPPVDGVEVAVLAGDSFLRVVNAGRRIDVPGYDGEEEYLRFEPDGTVWVNLRSVTRWQNEDRYADVAVPADTGPNVPAQWEQVSDDGAWAWHDHRIHWMSPTTVPGPVDPDLDQPQEALTWSVPIEVDGSAVAVTGALTWLPPASPMPTILAGLALAVAGVLVARRTRAVAVGVVVGIAVAVTGVVGIAMVVGLPAGVTSDVFPLVLSGIAALLLAVGLATRDRAWGLLVAGAAGIPMVVWAVTQWAAVTAAVVPPDGVPDMVVRIAVGLALGGGATALGIGVRDVFTRPLATAGFVEPGEPAR